MNAKALCGIAGGLAGVAAGTLGYRRLQTGPAGCYQGQTITCIDVQKNAPKPIGPYSSAVRTGNLIFCSGQVALCPETGALLGNGDVVAEARQALSNVKGVLEGAGTSIDHVVKATVFLQHMEDFAKVNEVYAQAFQGHRPARSAVEVAKLPKGALVEIEVIAVVE
mmetsp:Transcript_83414/g.169206  ORF Transcript_83414/g.169206 Transcript_83414/m.169206 type:complete len:166 (+) Transcript_83414:101-598(+)